MRDRETVFMVGLVAVLCASAPAHSDEPQAAPAVEQTEPEGRSRRLSRQVLTPTSFSPAVVEFLQRLLASQLATLNPDGSPQVTIMWFKYENDDLLFTTTTDHVKFRNQQKDPCATLAVLDPANMYNVGNRQWYALGR